MKPLISLQFREAKRQYWPGDELECQYQIDAIDPSEITSVEASVLWFTEGKGESDMAVHFFQRRLPGDSAEHDLRLLDRLRTRLPNSPLSYIGVILKLHWCVRVRVFYGKNGHATAELPFQLGQVPESRWNERAREESAALDAAHSTTAGDDDESPGESSADAQATPRRPRVIDVDDPAEQEKRALRAQRREARRLRREAANQEQGGTHEQSGTQEQGAAQEQSGSQEQGRSHEQSASEGQ